MRILFCTVSSEQAAALARSLVERRLVACVNRIQGIVSTYRWDGAVTEDGEDLLILKTSEAKLPALLKALPDLHPYDVPELLAWPVSEGHPPYLDWVESETAEK